MTKSMIAPLVSILALALGKIFGIEIGTDLQAQIVDAIITVVFVVSAVYGVFKNHKEKESN